MRKCNKNSLPLPQIVDRPSDNEPAKSCCHAHFIIDGRGKSNDRERIHMINQEMVEITVDVPEDLHQKVQVWADAHNMSVDEAASYIVTKSIEKKKEMEFIRLYRAATDE